MEAPKITFSEAEHRMIADMSVILTKNRATEKMGLLFANIATNYQGICNPLVVEFPAIFNTLPKISKGEKYHGFPWMMLDYPRCFSNERGHLAIRSFFWWGHYFSIQLLVSKTYLPSFLVTLPKWREHDADWLVGLTDDAWDLHLPNPDWRAIKMGATEASLSEQTVLKVAKKIPIEDWAELEAKFTDDYRRLMTLVQGSLRHQAGGTIP